MAPISRRIAPVLLALAAALAAPRRVRADPGVAFVHGTGHPGDARVDYWTPDFIDVVRAGLPDPDDYLVVDCDFTQALWDTGAAGCLADQLTAFIHEHDITSLVL